MFCCGCLNTEVKLRILDVNVTRDIKEFLGLTELQAYDRYLYEHICWTCYLVLMKSIKFKKQCLEARDLVFSMVHISRKSLNTLHMLNFKPNLTQSQVVLINVESDLEINEDSFYPPIQEIKSEVPDESTFTDVNETSPNVKVNFTEDNMLHNKNVMKSEVFIEVDEIAPETVLFVKDKDLKEEIVAKEECPDTSQDITSVEAATLSDEDTPLKNIKERQDRIILRGIDTCASASRGTLKEISKKVKRIKCEETSTDRNPIANADLKSLTKNNCEASDVNLSKNVLADSNVLTKKKQIIKSTVNCYEVNKISPKVNIQANDEIQTVNVIVEKNKTLTSNVCYSNAGNDTFKQFFPNSVDAVTPSTSLDRSKEGNKTNICNKEALENNLCHRYRNKCVTGNILSRRKHKNTEEKLYICDLCDYRCSQKYRLAEHIKYKHTKEKNHFCHICDYKSVTNRDLIRHLRKHTGVRSYICNICDNKFLRKNELSLHIKYKHTKEKNFSCHMCQYKCVTKNYLNIHLRKHTGEKPYTCNLCDKRFSQKSLLKSHIMYKHTKEMNFSCHMCQYKCVTKGALNSHLRKHTGEKPFTCDLCDNRFTQQCLLKRHIMYKHTKEKNFSCDTCQYKCFTKGALNSHLRKHNE